VKRKGGERKLRTEHRPGENEKRGNKKLQQRRGKSKASANATGFVNRHRGGRKLPSPILQPKQKERGKVVFLFFVAKEKSEPPSGNARGKKGTRDTTESLVY